MWLPAAGGRGRESRRVPATPEIGQVAAKDADAAIPSFRAHLDGCPACREEHESLRDLVAGELGRRP